MINPEQFVSIMLASAYMTAAIVFSLAAVVAHAVDEHNRDDRP